MALFIATVSSGTVIDGVQIGAVRCAVAFAFLPASTAQREPSSQELVQKPLGRCK